MIDDLIIRWRKITLCWHSPRPPCVIIVRCSRLQPTLWKPSQMC